MAFLKKLRPKSSESGSSGQKQMSLLRRLPKILRWIPGKAQDLRAWFLSMQYWLGGSDDNMEQMVRFLVSRYAGLPAWKGAKSAAPIDFPDVGVYHPRIKGRIGTKAADLPRPPGASVNPARFQTETLPSALDVPYIAAHPLEFQTIEQWEASSGGLGPVETTMLIALPEIDGATNPTVFAGRHGVAQPGETRNINPCMERVQVLAEKVARLASLRRSKVAERKVAIVLYGFPPNAGAVGTAAYLSVFESLVNTLNAMKAEGYAVNVPATVDDLRVAVLTPAYGQTAAVAAHVAADVIVVRQPWLDEIEAAWGPAPGRHQSDGRGVFVLGASFGNVFVGVQPVFGYEGDPMRLLFERGFAPTHAFTTFYRWLKEDFGADALLHFGMHGALEFVPGKQAGLSGDCWPDRLIGAMPNIYLYAANNPSEAPLAKRRANAVTVTHLTPPLARSGLYKGLAELKDSLHRWRALPDDASERGELQRLIANQAATVDMGCLAPQALWLKLLETEGALITDGLHVVGRAMSPEQRASMLALMGLSGEAAAKAEAALGQSSEIEGLLAALGGHFIPPVPGGDLIRNAAILPTGRNIHAFDPFRMPTAFALQDGAAQAERLLAAHPVMPRMVALVLWGSDNIKSDGGPIAQALALMGAKPRFDSYGRLCGADLIPLAEMGSPRIDVVMTLSGIFRDLLPLQTRMLAEAAWKCATAEEPLEQNFLRAHTLAYAASMNVDIETAALRVFSNAEGAYGSNVNTLVDSSAFDGEDELADAYEARKSFAYGRNGKPVKNAALLQKALKDVDLAYQNLESVELGVTSVDHYFDTLGGIARAVKRARGGTETPVYIGDQTRGAGKVHKLRDQIALETRSRSLNPRFYEPLLAHGGEGVRMIEAHVTNTMGWSATAEAVDPRGLSAPVRDLCAGRRDAGAAGIAEPPGQCPDGEPADRGLGAQLLVARRGDAGRPARGGRPTGRPA